MAVKPTLKTPPSHCSIPVRKPVLEWISAAAGLVLTCAMLGVIGWQAFTGTDARPPAVEVRAERVVPAAGGWVVVTAENLSPATAAGVEIEGALMRGREPLARNRATLDDVAGHSERRGGLFFEENPRTHDLELRALG